MPKAVWAVAELDLPNREEREPEELPASVSGAEGSPLH